MKNPKGSMTVEAVFVVSLILMVILWIMTTAIDMYQQTKQTAEIRWVNIGESASTFRNISLGKDVWELLK